METHSGRFPGFLSTPCVHNLQILPRDGYPCARIKVVTRSVQVAHCIKAELHFLVFRKALQIKLYLSANTPNFCSVCVGSDLGRSISVLAEAFEECFPFSPDQCWVVLRVGHSRATSFSIFAAYSQIIPMYNLMLCGPRNTPCTCNLSDSIGWGIGVWAGVGRDLLALLSCIHFVARVHRKRRGIEKSTR